MCDTHTHCALCYEDNDSDDSMLVMHVQNKGAVHGRPILLEMKEVDTVGAFRICCMSPRRYDIDNILRERANPSIAGMLGRRCHVVCRNDETC